MNNLRDDIRKSYKHALIKKRVLLGIFIAIIITFVVVGFSSAPAQRAIKSLFSDYAGGLNRKVTVYDYTGKPIKEYCGKFSIQESDNKVMFDDPKTGKRIIIYNSPVIAEEE